MKKLKTGDVVRLKKGYGHSFAKSKWAILGSTTAWSVVSRREARDERYPGERIAKVLKVSPKTVLVEVTR